MISRCKVFGTSAGEVCGLEIFREELILNKELYKAVNIGQAMLSFWLCRITFPESISGEFEPETTVIYRKLPQFPLILNFANPEAWTGGLVEHSLYTRLFDEQDPPASQPLMPRQSAGPLGLLVVLIPWPPDLEVLTEYRYQTMHRWDSRMH